MKKSLTATSIIESIVVLLIVVTGIVGVFTLLTSSQKLADSTSNRIEAIQIARDGLESFLNTRDTNWARYGADFENCWNVMNYDSSCLGTSSTSLDINHGANEGLIIYQDPTTNRFELDVRSYSPGLSDYSDSTYRQNFAVQKDLRGFYTQSGGTIYGVGGEPFYTREIRVDYQDASGTTQGPTASDNSRVVVSSIVQWRDTSSSQNKRIQFDMLLTNWKALQ